MPSLDELSAFLTSRKIADEEKITELKAEIYGLDYYNLQAEEISEETLNFLPEEIARNYKLVCFAREYKAFKIGLVEPDLKAMEAINFLATGEES